MERRGDHVESPRNEADRSRMANVAAVLTFATAFAALGALVAVASAISGAHPEPLRMSTAAPVVAALALMVATTSARRRLRRHGREPG